MLLAFKDFGIAFLSTLCVLPFIIWYFNKQKIHDEPGGRKVHKVVKPSMGGLAIFAGVVMSLGLSTIQNQFEYSKYLLLAGSIMLVTGMLDDIWNLSPKLKLLGQIPAALLLIHFVDIRITSFHGLFGINEIPVFVSYPLSLFVYLALINAFNLIDGIDGLAGTLATIFFTILGTWLVLAGHNIAGFACLALVGAILGFLVFNWEPSRIFMGDTGSLFLGFMLCAGVLYFINTSAALEITHPLKFENSVSAGICFIIIPLVDTLRVFTIRISEGRSPFSPDQNHLHHRLLKLGFNHSGAVLMLGFVNVFFIMLAFAGKDLNDNIMFPIIVATVFLLLKVLSIASKRKEEKDRVSSQKMSLIR
ncbi:MAG: MraY family glycosyltransferase [Flammeovirgaceae bacterium]